ncbi:putative phage abortive infection protein [Aeromonas veronii]|uniref:putative phage abortive infection protein n=1 Tax=Aeromonas veronii TaxID=654 RepID=UPI003D1DAE3A
MNSYEKPFYISLLIIFFIFALYGAALLWIVWPISEFSITKAGTFGDSFGVLTSFFTGIAFSGILATLFMQREDLKLTREELIETRKEMFSQSQTFARQRFEDSFYQLLKLYKENLKDLSIRTQEQSTRLCGVEALRFLILKFDKLWASQGYRSLPSEENALLAYKYELIRSIKSVFIKQSRYIGTFYSILTLIDEECKAPLIKETYWRILASQLTAYEVKYLFYQAVVYGDNKYVKNLLIESMVFQELILSQGFTKPNLTIFEEILEVKINAVASKDKIPMSKKQIKIARKYISARNAKLKAKSNQEKSPQPVGSISEA